MMYEITCKSCGNCVEIEAEAYHAAGTVKCHCGSTDLNVKQPPPTTAELILAFNQLSAMCPLCKGEGWADTGDGHMLPCGACGGRK